MTQAHEMAPRGCAIPDASSFASRFHFVKTLSTSPHQLAHTSPSAHICVCVSCTPSPPTHTHTQRVKKGLFQNKNKNTLVSVFEITGIYSPSHSSFFISFSSSPPSFYLFYTDHFKTLLNINPRV